MKKHIHISSADKDGTCPTYKTVHILNKLILCTVIILLCLIPLFAFSAYADFDNAGGGDFDIGDFDVGDFDAGDWDSNGFGTSFFDIFDFIFGFGGATFSMGGIGIIIFIIAVFFIVTKARHGGIKTGVGTAQTSENTVFDKTKQITEEIRKTDPSFSSSEFLTYAENVFIRSQESWQAKDLSTLRPYISDSYYNKVSLTMQEYIDKRKTNYIDGQSVITKFLYEYSDDGVLQTLTVCLKASILDYVKDDETGTLLSGSDTVRIMRNYSLVFTRSSGSATSSVKSTTECPHCGAPVDVTSAGVCQYCGNVIVAERHDWVLNSFSTIQI